MTDRFWFYLAAGIIIVGLLSGYTSSSNRQKRVSAQETSRQQQDQYSSFDLYLANQTDARKLLVLAKHLRGNDPTLLAKIADRAYALNPTARDVALFASYFRPELEEKVKQLDPLYTPEP